VSGRRLGGPVAILATMGGAAALLSFAVVGTGAYFTDSDTGSIAGLVEPPGTPPTPAECAGIAFGEVIVGTSGDDTITAGNGGALVFGLGGNDTITGGNAKDCLVGGDGNDIISGGNGKDVLLGGEGNDTIYGDAEADVLEGGNGKDVLDGGAGIDTCSGTSKDTFVSCEPTPTGGTSVPVSTAVPLPDTSPTPDPGATESLAPTMTAGPSASPTLDPGASVSPTPTAEPAPDPSLTPDPTATPTPDPTATPTLPPTPPPTDDPTAAPPTVDFTFSVSGLTVLFTNNSKAAESWTWDFGDGATSTARNPVHTYATGGTWTVTLVAEGTDGSTASMSVEITVEP
jgi:hypothetical protein